ncbi:hypothetical protein [Jatrophihabitans fulvus]
MFLGFRVAVAWHRPLMLFAAAMTVTALAAALGYLLDDRTLAGVPIWAKPLKFAVSFAVYAGTLAWLISRLQRPRARRWATRAGTVLAVASTLEMAAIVGQAVRGRQSHFNTATPFDRAVFGAMGALVVVIFLATVAVAAALLRDSPALDAPLATALRAGLLLSVVGMAVAFLMLRPTNAQSADGPRATTIGAHSVGAEDGGPSLPLIGWNTEAGDLRVPHFVGLHALQVLPLVALLLASRPLAARIGARARRHLMLVASGGYAGGVALTLWQALRGQSVVAPDAATLAAASALLSAVGVAAAVVIRSGRRSVLEPVPA